MPNRPSFVWQLKNNHTWHHVIAGVITLMFLGSSGILGYTSYQHRMRAEQAERQLAEQQESAIQLRTSLDETQATLTALENEDQTLRNNTLQQEIRELVTIFDTSLAVYEDLVDLRQAGARTAPLETQFALFLSFLSDRKSSSASATLASLKTNVTTTQNQLAAAAAAVVPENTPANNSPPESGYSRQVVETDVGRFSVDILSADLSSTRVVVETASSDDCGDNCPVDNLASFVSKAGGYAGINGPYFCPADYPSCAGKTNSYDTLIMNRQKKYFNSDNNEYSTVPALIFDGSSPRLVSKTLEWGRSKDADSVIASQPMLLSGGNITFGGSGDPKQGSRSSRSFIGTKGSKVYIGVVRGATVAEVAHVLKKLGLESALNLDGGGSTAFFANGKYVAGPGRNTPFGIVLVRR